MPGGRPWTRDDLRWLRRFRRDCVPLDDVADAMERTVVAVKTAYDRYLPDPSRRRFWTPAEDAIVRRDYKRIPTPELAASLGRSRIAVHRRANILGIVTPTPTLAEAESAYRHLSLLHHPDRGGTEEQMSSLNGAIERARRELK